MRHLTPPPPARLTALPACLVAALLALLALPAGEARAQTTCDKSICTVRVAPDRTVVDGCGDHATPGRMKVIFESTDGSVTRASFPVAGYFIQGASDFVRTAFSDWEWRSTASNDNRWQEHGLNRIGFAGGVLGENIVEVRPKAGARVWTNRNASNPNQGPGELVVQTFDLPSGSTTPYEAPGRAYFLFMGGKGCARVGPGGGLLGGNQ